MAGLPVALFSLHLPSVLLSFILPFDISNGSSELSCSNIYLLSMIFYRITNYQLCTYQVILYRLGAHQENLRVIFGVFVSGNDISESYVFAKKVFEGLCL